MKPEPRTTRRQRWVLAVALLAPLAAPAQAQLRLPGGGLSGLSNLPGSVGRLQPLRPAESLLSNVPLQELRQRTLRDLLRDHGDVLEADPAGEPVLRAELLLVSPSQASVDAAIAQGFRLLREQTLDGLDVRSVVLQPPQGVSTAQGLARLRALDAQLEVDFNHLYTRSGSVADAAPNPATLPDAGATAVRRVGLIDSGVESTHPALRLADLKLWGCDGAPVASAHGTAVASLLVGRDAAFVGIAPGATLFAADIYCGKATGGSAEAVAQALAWLARERVAVINISLVGPANRLLERAVRALAGRGHLIVAAVGNDGPAAPPLYPASYPNVTGVTGVTTLRRVLPEAAQGPQVAFAAPGAELAVALFGARGYVVARGTSFASPVVAGLLAEVLHAPDPAAAERALRLLSDVATDLGAPGRDLVYGWGLVGEQARIAPNRVHAAAHGMP
jgi:subtilisin family serine protease